MLWCNGVPQKALLLRLGLTVLLVAIGLWVSPTKPYCQMSPGATETNSDRYLLYLSEIIIFPLLF